MVKYQQIANTLREEIVSGKYEPGSQLPLEKDMCEQYNVSRITIKRAVDELVGQGLVVKRRGSGTFIKSLEQKVVKDFSMPGQFNGFTKNFAGKDIRTDVLQFGIINPDAEVASKLRIKVDDFVYYIVRIRYLENKPMVVEYTQMPIDVIPGLKREHVQNSIYSYIENTLKLKIQSAHRAIRALMPSQEEREWLGIGDKEIPIQEVAQLGFLYDGRPFEYSISHHRGDRNVFHTVSVH